MNVLAKTKKYFLGPIKELNKKAKRHPLFESFISYWNTLLASTTEQAYDDLLQEMKLKYSAPAMGYCSKPSAKWPACNMGLA